MSMDVGDSSDLIHGGGSGVRVFWLSRTDFEKRLLVVVGVLSLVVVGLVVGVGVLASENADLSRNHTTRHDAHPPTPTPTSTSMRTHTQDFLPHRPTQTRLHTLTHPPTHTATHPLTLTVTHPLTPTVTHPLTPTATHPLTPTVTHPLTSTVTHPLTPTATHPLTPSVTLSPTPTRPITRTPTPINAPAGVIVKYLRGPGAA